MRVEWECNGGGRCSSFVRLDDIIKVEWDDECESDSQNESTEENLEPTFFMIYLEGGGSPTYRHETIESAEAEAKRLSQKFGRPAYILLCYKVIEAEMQFKEQYFKFVHTADMDESSLPF